MNMSNSTEAYMRSMAKIGIRRHSRSRDLVDLSGWLVLWKPVGRYLLMIFPVLLLINISVASMVNSAGRSIVDVENKRHELMDKNIELLARKASLWSPDKMERLAAKKLGLHKTSRAQVGRFDRRSGTFIHP